jgi:uncharacterized protein
MLLGFTLANYRSFRVERTLQLTRPGRLHEAGFLHPDLVPAIAIFGANASGKSNLLRALGTMFSMIRSSASSEGDRLPFTPYALGEPNDEPTRFEVSTRFDGVRYDYGFTYDAEAIRSEWMYSWPSTRRRILFERNVETEGWYFGDSLTGPNQALSKATRSNALYLSTARLLNHEVLSEIQGQFVGLIKNISSENLGNVMQSTLRSLSKDAEREQQVTKLMARAEFGVVSLVVEEDTPTEEMRERSRRIFQAIMPKATPEEIDAQIDESRLLPQLLHSGAHGDVALPFGWESTGTRNFLALLGPILDRLATGGVLVVDEIDTSLHPRLVSELVRLFQNPEMNPRQAQLILSTHDVTVMMNTANYNVLQRDQIWFVAKAGEGISDLYPLLEFSPRRAEIFSRNYLLGQYGAVPEIDDHAFWGLWPDQVET